MRTLSKTLAVSITPAYTAGDALGAPVALGRFNGELRSLTVTDKGNQGPAGSILFFDGDPVALGATFTDNGAAVIPAAALAKLLAIVAMPTYSTLDTKKLGSTGNLGISLKSENLYMAIVATGTPDFVAVDDVVVKLGIADRFEA